jgi:type I restriction enzyme S subunit
MKLKTFFEKFDQFADAPDAVAKMRELVLELAVQGKLVSQNPKDEPASILLKKIYDSLLQMPKGATRKKLEQIPPVDSEELPFILPEGWEWCRLGNLGSIGSSCRVHQKDWTSSGVPFLRAREIVKLAKFGQVDNELFIAEELFQELSKDGLTPEKDDLMITGVGTIGIPYIVKNTDRFYFKDASVLIFKNLFRQYPLYLHAVLQSPYGIREIHRDSMGTTVHTLTIIRANLIPIPLPPLAEQKRIVAKVDELMALCDRLEAQQQERETSHAVLARASLARFADAPTPANLNLLFHKSYSIPPADLRKAILTLAVQGKLVPQNPKDESAEKLFARIHSTKENLIKERSIKRASVESNPSADTCDLLPAGWIWTRMGNTFDVRDGTHDTPKYTKEGYPLITSKNIYSGNLLFDGANLISEKDHRQICERSKVDRNDILFAMIGSIGNPVIVDTDRDFSIKNVALFKYYAAVDSEPRFLLLYLKLVAEEMRTKAAGGVQAFVSLGFLRNYVFPLPPLAEQRRIVAKVDQLMALVDQLETQLAASRSTAKNLLDAVVAEFIQE